MIKYLGMPDGMTICENGQFFLELTEWALKKNVVKSTVTTVISGDGTSRDSQLGRSDTFIK